jgi:hypothetical protein
MKRMTVSEIHEEKVRELGLDSTALDLTSIEAIAGALRRAGCFRCPCSSRTLVRSVIQPLRGLTEKFEMLEDLILETLEAMISHGDFLECGEVGKNLDRNSAMLLYAAPISFVIRQNGMAFLLGCAVDQHDVLPSDLEMRIEYTNHLRRICQMPGENLRNELTRLGLNEISFDVWLKEPPKESSDQQLLRYNTLLDSAQASREIPGLSLLDFERPVKYYSGRWVEPLAQTGRFVARRRQSYGAPLWCYVQMRDGNPERFIDFPIDNIRLRGCDEAWRLQLAIDAQRGKPQRFRIKKGTENTSILEIFSPIPTWAKRRWDTVGTPVPCRGCLFAYRLSFNEMEEELRFLNETLWLKELSSSDNMA